MNYDFEVVSSSAETKSMEVIYSAPGRQSVRIGMPLPSPGVDPATVVAQYAPVAMWAEQDRAVLAVPVGYKASYDTNAGVLPADPVAALKKTIIAATQKRLDDFAKIKGYDGILSACTYASSAIASFATEGSRARDLRDQTWAALYAIVAECEAGTRPTPSSFAEPLLPALTWTTP